MYHVKKTIFVIYFKANNYKLIVPILKYTTINLNNKLVETLRMLFLVDYKVNFT